MIAHTNLQNDESLVLVNKLNKKKCMEENIDRSGLTNITYLYVAKAEANAQRPSFNTSTTEVMFFSREVNGDTILASESLNAIPT